MRHWKLLFILLLFFSCTAVKNTSEEREVINLISGKQGQNFELTFTKGEAFNHPSFAIWAEDMEGNYIETLFVTQYVGTGNYAHGELEPGKWKNNPGEARRPATLPYWAFKRGIRAPDGLYVPSAQNPVPDAITGATPKGSFSLNTGVGIRQNKKFRLLMEINQPWDSNKFWTNVLYPGDNDYFTSLQPALVYAVTIDPGEKETEFVLNPIGHSHPSGKDGKLYTDLNTITTALEIAHKITVILK